jgi:DNA-binding response OmpR family regulator
MLSINIIKKLLSIIIHNPYYSGSIDYGENSFPYTFPRKGLYMTTKLTKVILLLDFSGEIRLEVAEHLRSLNYIVLTASTFIEALGQLNTTEISLLIFDGALQKEFGEIIIEALNEKSPAASIALAISDDNVPQKFGIDRTGSYALLNRPITPTVLEHTLRQLESQAQQLEKNGVHFHNTALENATLESLVHSLERQNMKLQNEHKKLSKASAHYRHELFLNQTREQQLSAVQVAIDSTREAVLILGADGRVHYANPDFQEQFGTTQSDENIFPIENLFTDPGMN